MTDFTPKEKWQAKFLAALEKRPIVARACRCAGVSRQTVYNYRDGDEAFARAWEEARQTGIDALEEKAWERAETISDTLMIFILKGQRPEVYGDTSRIDLFLGRMSDEQLDTYIASRLEKAGSPDEIGAGAPALAEAAASINPG